MSHIGYMSTPNANRIAEKRKSKGLTQAQLAEAVGSHWITISKLERGIIRVTDEWREKIAGALGIDPWDLVAGSRPLPRVPIVGRLFDDGEIDDISDEDLFIQLNDEFFTHPEHSWLEVGDHGLYPWFQVGDVICVLQLAKEEIGDHIGRICVGWFNDAKGEADVTIGILQQGSTENTHTIQRIGLMPIQDAELTSLSVVAMSIYDVGKGRSR